MSPKYTKGQMVGLLHTVAKYVATVIPTPLDNDWSEPFEMVYDFLWASDELKFATEAHLSGPQVKATVYVEYLDRARAEYSLGNLPGMTKYLEDF